MSPALLLLQYACQNIALFCGALYAGACVYVSLVEHPSIVDGDRDLADAYVLGWHPRPAVFHGVFGLAGAASAALAAVAGAGGWWLAGAAVLGLGAIVHVAVLLPMMRKSIEVAEDEVPRAMKRLVRLNGFLGLAGLLALLIFILCAGGQ